MQYYLSMKKKEILSFVTTWMDFEGIILSETSQTEKDTYRMDSLVNGIKNKQTNKQTSQAHRYREWICGCHRWVDEMGEGGQKYKLPLPVIK